jgi:hypothetical protein
VAPSIDENGNTVTEIISQALGTTPTRIIVVEELVLSGVISKKKGRKRVAQILNDEAANIEVAISGVSRDG